MKEKVGQVFSIAKENRPVPGCTISKAIHDSSNEIIYFSLAADTDISAEIFPYHKLILVAEGSLEVYGSDGFTKKLEAGDEIFITNPWETLTYIVESIDIIGPYDSHKVMIQEGRDMVTLLTCHPYRSHGKQRYVVYCVRDEGEDKGEDRRTEFTENVDNKTTTQPFVSSEPDIQMENNVRYASGLIIILMCGFTFFRKRH